MPSVPDRRFLEAFAAVVRERRGELLLTVAEVADRAGTSPSYIAALESGRRDPNVTGMWELAAALRLSPVKLAGLMDEKIAADRPA